MYIIFVLVSRLAHVLCFGMFFHVPVPCFFCVYVCVCVSSMPVYGQTSDQEEFPCWSQPHLWSIGCCWLFAWMAHPLTVWLSFIRRWIVEWHSTALTLTWTCLLIVSLSTPNWSSCFFFIGTWKGVCHGSGAVWNYQVLEFHLSRHGPRALCRSQEYHIGSYAFANGSLYCSLFHCSKLIIANWKVVHLHLVLALNLTIILQ